MENPESAVNDRVADCLLFNAFFRFFNFGPNITTYLIPLESWPTPIRGNTISMYFGYTYHRVTFSSAAIDNALVKQNFLKNRNPMDHNTHTFVE